MYASTRAFMNKWQDMFEIQQDSVNWGINQENYVLYNKIENRTQGRYRDYRYAVKQARYKFRKALKRVDKILLG